MATALVVAMAAALVAVSLYHTMSPSMSMKEFLDRNLLDSLDGGLEAYSPGDVVEITDTIHSVSTTGEYTVLELRSLQGTGYSTANTLMVGGNLTSTLAPGYRVRITMTVGLSEDREREIFLPLTPNDITVLGEG